MKNRLAGLRCYLAGPIDAAQDLGAGWRKEIAKFLIEMGVSVYNPLEKPINIGREDFEHREERRIAKENKDWWALRDYMKVIRNIDLRMVDVSDFLVVYYNKSIPTCGTWEEIFLANREKKPVLVVTHDGLGSLPDWVFGTLRIEHMFEGFRHLEEYLREVAGGYDDGTGRWVFFDNIQLKEIQNV